MEKGQSPRKVVATLLALTLTLATLPSLGFNSPERAYASQTDQSSLTPSETLYLSIFLADSGAPGWAENLYFDFNNTLGIPLNMSLPAFSQHFQNADYSIVQGTSWDEFLMLLTVSYDAIDVGLAENYTDEICEQFQNAFNFNLTIIDKWHEVNNETGYVTVYRSLGYIYLEQKFQDLEIMEELVKYKPDKGFGQLINSDFLDRFTAGHIGEGLIDLEYTLKRVDQNTLSWRFVVGFEPSFGDVPGNETHVTVNFNDVLNHSGSIVPSGQGLSSVQLEIKNFAVGEYNMTLENVVPHYTTKENEEEGDILLIYNLTSPIDNIVASLEIAKLEGSNNPSWPDVAIVAAAIIGLLVAGLVYVRRRRRFRKRVAPEKPSGQEVK
ncbi:MAG TPA: hypothetical protein VEH86_05100 [Candidatus Acidoferrum sp.]|nr:hypothetical protein [Candidatus Acidoferrum sp.]